DRREAIERLQGGTIFVTANRDVHHARVAEHVIHRIAGGHVARGLADDDAQLDLVVRATVRESQRDGVIGTDYRRRRLEEPPVLLDGVQLVLGLRAHLLDVEPVVDGRRDDLAGKDDGRPELDPTKRDTLTTLQRLAKPRPKAIEVGDRAQEEDG